MEKPGDTIISELIFLCALRGKKNHKKKRSCSMKISLVCSFNAKVRMQNRTVDMLVTMCVGGCVGGGGGWYQELLAVPRLRL